MARHLLSRGALVATLAVLTAAASLAAPPAAHADRCQPEELIGVAPLTAEQDNAFCIVMIDVVYPALACDSVSLNRCLATLNPVATVTGSPGHVLATPDRVIGAILKMPSATRRAVCPYIGPPLGLNPDNCGAT